MTTSRRRLALVVAAVAAVAGISVLWSSASAATPTPATPDATTTGSPVQAPAEPGYWTPERMRAAQPAPMPSPDGS